MVVLGNSAPSTDRLTLFALACKIVIDERGLVLDAEFWPNWRAPESANPGDADRGSNDWRKRKEAERERDALRT